MRRLLHRGHAAVSGRRVAVIGAGMAGLACARLLAREPGTHVRVFDKARGPGGRVSTRRAGELAFDHGAQYFTCRTPRFRAQVDAWLMSGVVAPWPGKVVTIEGPHLRGDPGRDPRYVGTPRMSALGRDLARALDLALEARVETVERIELAGRSFWELRLIDGTSEGPFDAVVVATPAPQATPLLASAPELASRVAGIPMEPCHAAMVAFESPPSLDWDAAFVRGSPLAWVARNDSKPGRGDASTWVLQTSVEWSEAHLEDEREALGPVLVEALAKLTGAELPPVAHLAVHRWLYARCERPLCEPFLYDAARGIGVCGDWMVGGRVEGAFTSGTSLGDAMRGAWQRKQAT